MAKNQIYLSRRNLEALLSKLDRNRDLGAGSSAATIIKCDNQHPVYPQTMPEIYVTAVEDSEYYSHRAPGAVHPLDDPNNK